MSRPTPTLFKGLTFYIQPFCKMSQDSQKEVKQREDLMRVVRGYGGQISYSPTHPTVSHIIITSLKPHPKNEIITIKRRTDSYTYPRPPPVRMLDEYGWATFRLVEDFGGVLIPMRSSSSNRNNGTGEEERWDRRRVVLKEDWLFDCIAEEMVLGEYQDWNGWRVRARYEGEPIPPKKPISSKLPNAEPLRPTTWYTPSEFDNRPNQLYRRGDTSSPPRNGGPVKLPHDGCSNKTHRDRLVITREQVRIPIVIPRVTLPPDPRVSARITLSSIPPPRSVPSPLVIQSPHQSSSVREADSHSDSDLDCLNSDTDDQENCGNEVNQPIIGQKRSLLISQMRFKKHRKTESPGTLVNPLRLDTLPSYSASSSQLPPTPISAFRATDLSTAHGATEICHSLVTDLNKPSPFTRRPKPVGTDAWTIIAREIVDNPKEGIQSVCKRLAEVYEGRTWGGWKSLHWRNREEIEEMQKVMKGM